MPTYRIALARTGATSTRATTNRNAAAAERAGIALPSPAAMAPAAPASTPCAGTIAYTIEWPGLTREEKAEGLVLPCVALPRSDIVLAKA